MTITRPLQPQPPVLSIHKDTPVGKTEELLRQTQASLNVIIENSRVIIYSLDREFRYTNFNNYHRNIMKRIYHVDIRIGDVIFDFLYKNDPQRAEEWKAIYTCALNGQAMQFVKEFTVGDYHSFIRFYIKPIFEGHFIFGLSCLAIDITAEKKADLAVARSESKFRYLIENNQDAIMVSDRDRNVTYASPSVMRMVGLDDKNLESLKGYGMQIHHDDIAKLAKLYEDAIRFPGTPFPATLRVKHKLGHYIWIEGLLTNMLDIPDVEGFVCNFRDVTERIEKDLHTEHISKDLVKRNENLEQYGYIVSHNLRGPVANLVGLANLLESPRVDPNDREKALAHIVFSVRRLDDVIRDLSSILRVDQEISQHRETVRFQDLVDTVSWSIDAIVTDDVVIETDFLQCESIVSIKSYLYSIFYNLISNSIKYRKPDASPVIRIRSQRSNDRVTLIFQDNGLGIDLSSYRNKIFGLYNRFHPDRATGRGIGLFMVRTQVENLGGNISVSSTVNEGTTFTIEL